MDEVKPLKVLHSARIWLQRTKTWIFQQVKALPADVEAHVVCDSTENLAQFPHARLHVLSARSAAERQLERWARRLGVSELRFAARLATQLRAEVLHSHFGPEAWRERGVASAAGLGQVVTFYGYDVTRTPASSPEWRRRYLQLFDSAALVLCEGPHMRAELLALGADPRRTRVQHLGIDLERFRFVQRTRGAAEPLRILLAASFNEKKGLDFALRGVIEAVRRRPALAFSVSVVGDASDEPESQRRKRELQELAGNLGSERVSFLGFRPHAELLSLATEHDVFMSPSVKAADGDTEGGAPVTLIELAATGLPVISTTHCDIPNVLRGPAARLLAPERDAAGLAERLLWLVDHREQWAEITGFVRKEIEERFDAAEQGRRLGELYHEVAAEVRARPRSSSWLRRKLLLSGTAVNDSAPGR